MKTQISCERHEKEGISCAECIQILHCETYEKQRLIENQHRITTYRMQVCTVCKANQYNEDCYGTTEDIETCIDLTYESIHQYEHIPR
jgi:hypothetical protein